jgi:hypothetical protein
MPNGSNIMASQAQDIGGGFSAAWWRVENWSSRIDLAGSGMTLVENMQRVQFVSRSVV